MPIFSATDRAAICRGGCTDDDVAALSGCGDCLELSDDRAFRQLAPPLGRKWGRSGRWAGGGHLAQLGTDWRDGEAETVNPLREVGRHAQADLLTERPQLRRQRHNGWTSPR